LSIDHEDHQDAPHQNESNEVTLDRLRADISFMVEQRLRETRRALIAQEHRLIPALSTLLHTIFVLKGEDRRTNLAPAATAVFWCLLPSAGTTAVSTVALLSLIVAWQQARLLAAQNEKIEMQNVLAEAQRRSALVFETTALLELVEREKQNVRTIEPHDSAVCPDVEQSYSCWAGSRAEEGRFVPSRATLGRLAALSRALRPYKYLNVEDSPPYRFVGQQQRSEVCAETIESPTIKSASNLLVRAAYQFAPEDASLKDPNTLKQKLAEIYSEQSGHYRTYEQNMLSFISGMISSFFQLLGLEYRSEANIQMNCAPSSPERGQLLISLHAASVDISRLVAAGGDLRYADVPGAQLNEIYLKKVDLSFSRLPGANFTGAHLEGVTFDHAHLAGASFRNATLRSTSFDGAILQRFNDAGASVNLFAASVAEKNALGGIRFVELGRNDSLFDRVCIAGSMYARLDHKTMRLGTEVRNLPMMDELRRFALVVESSSKDQAEIGRGMIGIIVPKSLESSQQLVSIDSLGGRTVRLDYMPFDKCESWPQVSSSPASNLTNEVKSAD
jgi:hypothetical protein